MNTNKEKQKSIPWYILECIFGEVKNTKKIYTDEENIRLVKSIDKTIEKYKNYSYVVSRLEKEKLSIKKHL